MKFIYAVINQRPFCLISLWENESDAMAHWESMYSAENCYIEVRRYLVNAKDCVNWVDDDVPGCKPLR